MADSFQAPQGAVQIQWSYSLPGIQVCQFTGGQKTSWLSELLLAPCSFLFCQTGRLQIFLAHGQVIELNPHDVLLLSNAAPILRIQSAVPFPQGIRMTLDGIDALEPLTRLWSVPGTRLQPEKLQVRLQAHGGWLLFPSGLWSSSFFAQLDELPQEEWGEYCALKAVELLYLLSGRVLTPAEGHGRRYWDRDQLHAIHQAHDYMLANLSYPLTIDQLSQRFHISGTFLKEGFRQIYGQPIRKFLQARRMDRAAELLRTSSQSVIQIASAVGYDSASQFSQIFKRHYHLPPAQYRREAYKRNV